MGNFWPTHSFRLAGSLHGRQKPPWLAFYGALRLIWDNFLARPARRVLGQSDASDGARRRGEYGMRFLPGNISGDFPAGGGGSCFPGGIMGFSTRGNAILSPIQKNSVRAYILSSRREEKF